MLTNLNFVGTLKELTRITNYMKNDFDTKNLRKTKF